MKAYLRLLTYYGRFLPNLSTVLSPLYRLLRQDVCWHWTSKQQRAFTRSKQLLTSAKVLVHYNPRLDLVVAGDASAYGIGAVLSHKMPNGEESQLHLRLEHCHLRNAITLKWRKKHWRVCLLSRSFTHTFSAGRLHWSQTTSRYLPSLERTNLYLHKHQQECNDGP